jgi:hypothetical protein
MAAQMQGGPAFNNGVLSNTEVIADETRQRSLALLLGQITNDSYNLWLNAVPNDGSAPQIVAQPKSIEHFNGATFTWLGGSTAIDNPVARVEREVSPGTWKTFADGSGEVQTMVGFPTGVAGVAQTWLGMQSWMWTANFEGYAAHPTRLGSTPPGNYRFVVDGKSRQNMADVTYHFVSAVFTVSNWGGLNVQNAVVDSVGNVSFDFAPVVYPRSYSSPFKFVQDNGDQRICDQCSFRPWARKGVAKSAVVTVRRKSGTVQTFAATLTNGHYKAATKLLTGDQAFIAPGGLRDNNNETNRAQIVLR